MKQIDIESIYAEVQSIQKLKKDTNKSRTNFNS